MKHIQTFESYLNENYAKFEVGKTYMHPKLGKFEVIELAGDSKTKVKFLEGSAKGDISYIAGYGSDGYTLVESLMNEETLNERSYNNPIELIHFETDPKKQEELKIAYGKSTGEVTSAKAIEAADYMLKKFRKEIRFGDGMYLGVFLPGSFDAIMSTLGDGPHTKKQRKAQSWNQRSYDKWIKDYAGNGGAEHAFDMAQNAKYEPGLIDWVKRNNPGVDPLQRIQWDIEAYA
jgi:hypothetical protein